MVVVTAVVVRLVMIFEVSAVELSLGERMTLVSNMGVETIIGSECKGLGGDITGEAGWLNPSRATMRTMAALTHLLLVRLELLR